MKNLCKAVAWVVMCGLVLGNGGRSIGSEPVYEPHPLSDAYEYESNDSWVTASDLMTSNQYIMNLSIYPQGDEDWYLWTASEPGTLRVYVYELAWGALELTVFGNDRYNGWTQKVSSNPYYGLEVVEFSVKVPGDYMIRVHGVDGATSDNYLLWIDGTAHDGTFNSSPQVITDRVTVTEATWSNGVWPLANDYDWDGDSLYLLPHSDQWGCAEMSAAQPVMYYLPGTSITKSHPFYYIADDGRGGKAKGLVKVTINPLADNLAFPGAQGFAARASGGRGGPVHVVTNLLDNGWNQYPIPGSLRAALNNGPGVVVFAVSGVIRPDQYALLIPSNVTIAGETAPGPEGITIYGDKLIFIDPDDIESAEDLARIHGQSNVIVRNLRFRNRDFQPDVELDEFPDFDQENPESDALSVVDSDNVIVDHCSLSWGNDGTMDIWRCGRAPCNGPSSPRLSVLTPPLASSTLNARTLPLS